MKIWQIVTPENEMEIEVSDSTLLYGQSLIWNQLIHQIDDFFNARNTQIKIYEGSLPINKKDWNCYLIPFDADIQLSKITASSPLRDVRNDVTAHLTHSPLFQELIEIWEQLDGELEFTNQRLAKWGIQAKLSNFDEKSLSTHIFFNPSFDRYLSPLEVKTLLIRIILEKPLEKKTLIIVELPELYADEQALHNFKITVDNSVSKGYQFLFVSQNKDLGTRNYYYKNKIIHLALLEQIKSKIRNEVPFYCSDDLYEQASTLFLQLVDNSITEEQLMKFSDENAGALVTIIHTIMYNLNMESIHVPQGLEPNLKKFISNLG